MGYSKEDHAAADLADRVLTAARRYRDDLPTGVDYLAQHPNFEISDPEPGESEIEYAVRMCAHLVSPPKEPGEDCEITCETVAEAILGLGLELEEKYFDAHESDG